VLVISILQNQIGMCTDFILSCDAVSSYKMTQYFVPLNKEMSTWSNDIQLKYIKF